MTDWPRPQGETEPEIIPPEARRERRAHIWIAEAGDVHRYRRLRVSQPTPVTLLLLGMALGAGALLVLLLLLGAVLLWLPLIGLIALAAVLAGLLRGPQRRRY
jgi:hypothetical protein